MAVRDAGDYGFGLSFDDAVKKGRRENWSDRDIAALLHVTESEVARVPIERIALKLEELVFRPDPSEGGVIIEYLVDGRKKTQSVPRMVGEILESQNDAIKELRREVTAMKTQRKEPEVERPSGTDGDGISFSRGPGSVIGGRPSDKGKGKAKARAKA